MPKKVHELFRHYKNREYLSVELEHMDMSKEDLRKEFLKTYDSIKTGLLLGAFSKGQRFLIDKIALYDDDENQKTHYRVPDLIYHSINTSKTKVHLGIVIEQWYKPIATSSRRKPIPRPNDLSRMPVQLMGAPLVLYGTFKILGGLDADFHEDTSIHEYYDELAQIQLDDEIAQHDAVAQHDEVAQHGGVKPKTGKARGLAALKKQDIIDRCRAKKIPYSGRTKAELVAALRR